MKTNRTGVQSLYTEERLLRHLWVLKLSGKSLRTIANDEFPGLTHCDIQRALQGKFPKGKEKRRLFRLPTAEDEQATRGELYIKGQPYAVEAVIQAGWVTPQHPDGPPVVVVRMQDRERSERNDVIQNPGW